RSSEILAIPDKLSDIMRVRYWEIIADNLSNAGWSWGCVSAIDSNGRTIWIADAHRGDGSRPRKGRVGGVGRRVGGGCETGRRESRSWLLKATVETIRRSPAR